MIIRQYEPADRQSIEEIQFNTYFLGKSMSKFVSNRKPFSAELARYFEESESIFVAEDKGRIVGYLIGCLDDSKHNKRLSYANFVLSNFTKSLFFSKQDRAYWASRFAFLFNILIGKSGELKMKTPANAGHLHINLLPSSRGKGAGSKLLQAFFRYAKKKGIKVVHADSFETRLNPNKSFWIKNGFKPYSRIRTLSWKKQLPKEEIYYVCYVKAL
ncbi:GNAT family N-acetyltransferase [Candidatus Woesearchaeota archaeon]|nr:GNAT family N-acetyltransferase [Candidatus Woesearchaeota archaeon]